jgi:hypothetical protein
MCGGIAATHDLPLLALCFLAAGAANGFGNALLLEALRQRIPVFHRGAVLEALDRAGAAVSFLGVGVAAICVRVLPDSAWFAALAMSLVAMGWAYRLELSARGTSPASTGWGGVEDVRKPVAAGYAMRGPRQQERDRYLATLRAF